MDIFAHVVGWALLIQSGMMNLVKRSSTASNRFVRSITMGPPPINVPVTRPPYAQHVTFQTAASTPLIKINRTLEDTYYNEPTAEARAAEPEPAFEASPTNYGVVHVLFAIIALIVLVKLCQHVKPQTSAALKHARRQCLRLIAWTSLAVASTRFNPLLEFLSSCDSQPSIMRGIVTGPEVAYLPDVYALLYALQPPTEGDAIWNTISQLTKTCCDYEEESQGLQAALQAEKDSRAVAQSELEEERAQVQDMSTRLEQANKAKKEAESRVPTLVADDSKARELQRELRKKEIEISNLEAAAMRLQVENQTISKQLTEMRSQKSKTSVQTRKDQRLMQEEAEDKLNAQSQKHDKLMLKMQQEHEKAQYKLLAQISKLSKSTSGDAASAEGQDAAAATAPRDGDHVSGKPTSNGGSLNSSAPGAPSGEINAETVDKGEEGEKPTGAKANDMPGSQTHEDQPNGSGSAGPSEGQGTTPSEASQLSISSTVDRREPSRPQEKDCPGDTPAKSQICSACPAHVEQGKQRCDQCDERRRGEQSRDDSKPGDGDDSDDDEEGDNPKPPGQGGVKKSQATCTGGAAEEDAVGGVGTLQAPEREPEKKSDGNDDSSGQMATKETEIERASKNDRPTSPGPSPNIADQSLIEQRPLAPSSLGQPAGKLNFEFGQSSTGFTAQRPMFGNVGQDAGPSNEHRSGMLFKGANSTSTHRNNRKHTGRARDGVRKAGATKSKPQPRYYATSSRNGPSDPLPGSSLPEPSLASRSASPAEAAHPLIADIAPDTGGDISTETDGHDYSRDAGAQQQQTPVYPQTGPTGVEADGPPVNGEYATEMELDGTQDPYASVQAAHPTQINTSTHDAEEDAEMTDEPQHGSVSDIQGPSGFSQTHTDAASSINESNAWWNVGPSSGDDPSGPSSTEGTKEPLEDTDMTEPTGCNDPSLRSASDLASSDPTLMPYCIECSLTLQNRERYLGHLHHIHHMPFTAQCNCEVCAALYRDEQGHQQMQGLGPTSVENGGAPAGGREEEAHSGSAEDMVMIEAHEQLPASQDQHAQTHHATPAAGGEQPLPPSQLDATPSSVDTDLQTRSGSTGSAENAQQLQRRLSSPPTTGESSKCIFCPEQPARPAMKGRVVCDVCDFNDNDNLFYAEGEVEAERHDNFVYGVPTRSQQTNHPYFMSQSPPQDPSYPAAAHNHNGTQDSQQLGLDGRGEANASSNEGGMASLDTDAIRTGAVAPSTPSQSQDDGNAYIDPSLLSDQPASTTVQQTQQQSTGPSPSQQSAITASTSSPQPAAASPSFRGPQGFCRDCHTKQTLRISDHRCQKCSKCSKCANQAERGEKLCKDCARKGKGSSDNTSDGHGKPNGGGDGGGSSDQGGNYQMGDTAPSMQPQPCASGTGGRQHAPSDVSKPTPGRRMLQSSGPSLFTTKTRTLPATRGTVQPPPSCANCRGRLDLQPQDSTDRLCNACKYGRCQCGEAFTDTSKLCNACPIRPFAQAEERNKTAFDPDYYKTSEVPLPPDTSMGGPQGMMSSSSSQQYFGHQSNGNHAPGPAESDERSAASPPISSSDVEKLKLSIARQQSADIAARNFGPRAPPSSQASGSATSGSLPPTTPAPASSETPYGKCEGCGYNRSLRVKDMRCHWCVSGPDGPVAPASSRATSSNTGASSQQAQAVGSPSTATTQTTPGGDSTVQSNNAMAVTGTAESTAGGDSALGSDASSPLSSLASEPSEIDFNGYAELKAETQGVRLCKRCSKNPAAEGWDICQVCLGS